MGDPVNGHESWGRYPRVTHGHVEPIYWRDEVPDLSSYKLPVLPFGQGRSYGDVCLNEGGVLLDTKALSRFIEFDREAGLLRCEGGVTLEQILQLIVPHGWFLPVTPGTKYVSVGGAIANDIHGKNHHVAGTFGRHVTRFALLRSTGERLIICSPDQNEALFGATIGGLGLTGLILWAEFRLKPIPGPCIEVDQIRYHSLEEFFALSAESNETHEYTVAWIDGLAQGRKLGRGLFIRGNTAAQQQPLDESRWKIRVPFDMPGMLLNQLTIRAFNTLYYYARASRVTHRVVHYEPFFYPLDALLSWNRMYGRSGFFQYQCVVPFGEGHDALRAILERISRSGRASFLAVLKTFGDVPSPGLMSFPRPGVTLALDFPYDRATLQMFDELDAVVREAGGAVYPAKDAHMSAEDFQSFYPQWETFMEHIDPAFSSSFWRRVAGRKEHVHA